MTTMYRMYAKPIFALAQHWLAKSLVSALAALLAHDVQLVVLISVLVILDFLTGIWASLQRGDAVKSREMRGTASKVITYAVLLAVVGMISNSFQWLSWAVTTAYAYVAITEATSIIENVARDGSVVNTIWDNIKSQIEQQITTKR